MSLYNQERSTLRKRTAELYQQVFNQQMPVDQAVQEQMMMMDVLAPTVTVQQLAPQYPVVGGSPHEFSVRGSVVNTLLWPVRTVGEAVKFIFHAAMIVFVFMSFCVILGIAWNILSPLFMPILRVLLRGFLYAIGVKIE